MWTIGSSGQGLAGPRAHLQVDDGGAASGRLSSARREGFVLKTEKRDKGERAACLDRRGCVRASVWLRAC